MAGLRTPRVVVIGAGMAGLSAAVDLAARGVDVTVLERAAAPGGKMRAPLVADRPVDSGPTVLTMRWILEDVFAAAGTRLDRHVGLTRADVLARHAWGPDERLDLHADPERSAEAIGAFAGAAEADRFRAFCARARMVHRALDRTFIQAERPNPVSLTLRGGARGALDMWRIRPFATLWRALGDHFTDPRLRQLFGRYATYCGASPYRATATLMLVAHVEQEGVWLVEGGMHRLARALADLATGLGARVRYDAEAAEILSEGGRAAGVRLADGERIAADAVIANADVAALASGRLGPAAMAAVPPMPRAARSLSAVTWSMVAETAGFPLAHHNVFFSGDYRAEFEAIFRHGRVPEQPTVYVCAQDRGDGVAAPAGAERLLVLVNAPPSGDVHTFPPPEIESCAERTFAQLERCGLNVRRRPEATTATSPADFERLFPGTGGALYGRAPHGWRASFQRPGARTRLPGLYLAGGSVHPGPGVPMAAMSGRLAAARLMADLASTFRSRATATPGGMSTRSATTAGTG